MSTVSSAERHLRLNELAATLARETFCITTVMTKPAYLVAHNQNGSTCDVIDMASV